jgi:hypothetical protein
MVRQVVEAFLRVLSLALKDILALAKELLDLVSVEMLVALFGQQCAEFNLTLFASGKPLLKKSLRSGHNGRR